MGNAAVDRIALSTDSVAVAAKRVGSHAEDIRASHAATQAMLDDGLYGCVGSSGEELSRLSQRWSATGVRHGERLDALGRHVGEAGVKLTEADRVNAERVARVADDLR
jgi:uncharacterized protein YukE